MSSKSMSAADLGSKIDSAPKSTESQVSLGLDTTGFNDASIGDQRLYDVVQLALVCRTHHVMLFASIYDETQRFLQPKDQKLSYYFPFATTKPGESAAVAIRGKIRDLTAQLGLRRTGVKFADAVLVDLLHIQIPPYNEFINRYTFRLEQQQQQQQVAAKSSEVIRAPKSRLTASPSSSKASPKNAICVCRAKVPRTFAWIAYDETDGFAASANQFWAIEPCLLWRKILLTPLPLDQPVLQEITLENMCKYLAAPPGNTASPDTPDNSNPAANNDNCEEEEGEGEEEEEGGEEGEEEGAETEECEEEKKDKKSNPKAAPDGQTNCKNVYCDSMPLFELCAQLQLDAPFMYRMFLEYLHFTYPSIYMNRRSFVDWHLKARSFHYTYDTDRLLTAASIDPEHQSPSIVSKFGPFIDYDEFFLLQLFCDSSSPPASASSPSKQRSSSASQNAIALIHISYIFRYYAKGAKCTMEYDDLLELFRDVEVIANDARGSASKSSHQKKQRKASPTAVTQSADFFWDQAKMSKKSKGNGIAFSVFARVAGKLNTPTTTMTIDAKIRKYFNFNAMLRAQSLQLKRSQVESSNDWLVRSTHLGRDLLDIVRKRDAICSRCDFEPRCTIAEHAIRILFDGAIDEVIDLTESLKNSINRSDKARRRQSNALFCEDHFPNILLEALGNYAIESSAGGLCAIRNAKQPTNAANRAIDPIDMPGYRWNGEFAIKFLPKILDLIRQISATQSQSTTGTLSLASPCVAISIANISISALFTIEQNISHIVSFAFSIRYVLLLSYQEVISQISSQNCCNIIETLMWFLANKSLSPDKFHLIAGSAAASTTGATTGAAADKALREKFATNLAAQCEKLLRKAKKENACEHKSLANELMRLLDRSPKMAKIDDEAVHVFASVDRLPAPVSPSSRISDDSPKRPKSVANATKSKLKSQITSTISDQNDDHHHNKKRPKQTSKIKSHISSSSNNSKINEDENVGKAKKSSVMSKCTKSPSRAKASNSGASEDCATNVQISKETCITLFTEMSKVPKGGKANPIMIYARTYRHDYSSVISLGSGDCVAGGESNNEKCLLLTLIEAEKIRLLYMNTAI